MIVNGFNSDDYRYFKNKKTGKLYKFKNSSLNQLLFKTYIHDLNTEYPKDKLFDLIEFIKMQPPITFDADGYEDFHFKTDEYCLMTEWLEDRIFAKNIPIHLLFTTSETIKAHNLDKLSQIDDSEKIDINSIEFSNFLITLSSINNKFSLSNLKRMYKFNRGICFRLPFKQGEKWDLSKNIGLLFLIVNHNFVKLIYDCDEILGKEKEKIFYEQYKDNIPNTTLKYYKLNDNVKVKTPFELYNLYADVNICFCQYNKNNYDADGNIRYFYIKFYNTNNDLSHENNILQYATRLCQEDAIKNYTEDLEAEKLHKRELEALEYVKKHISKYKKGTNRNMTPLEFMESEQKKEREYLGKRLTKTLYKRMEYLKQQEK